MVNVNIRVATINDFENIYCLITKVHNTGNNVKANWENLLKKHWCKKEDILGYVLTSDYNIEGYLGTIFSYRVVDDKLHKFCNLTTWVVSENYRKYSIQLLFKILTLRNITFTAFTPSKTANIIYSNLGFKKIENEIVIIPFYINYKFLMHQCIIEYNKNVIITMLGNNEAVIFNDHLNYDCIYFLLKELDNTCLVIGKRVKIKQIPFVRIHYISNKSMFNCKYKLVCHKVSIKYRIFGMIIDNRYLNSSNLSNLLIRRKLAYPTMYKSDINMINDIDSLYSEYFLLNI